MLAVLHPRQNFLFCGTIALELVRNDHPRDILAALEPHAEERLGGCLVAPALHQDIKHVAILIDGPPQVMALTVDRQKDLIQVPRVTGPGTPAPELIGIRLAERATPLPNRLIRHDD